MFEGMQGDDGRLNQIGDKPGKRPVYKGVIRTIRLVVVFGSLQNAALVYSAVKSGFITWRDHADIRVCRTVELSTGYSTIREASVVHHHEIGWSLCKVVCYDQVDPWPPK